jgi:glycosyltransferase involved in cell wall biosynthesis
MFPVDSVIRVIHVGPTEGPANGMQTVIRTLADNKLGADETEMLPTWEIGTGLRRRLLPALKSAIALLMRDLRGTIVHIHVAHKGSFARKSLILLAARIRGATVVVTPHSGGFTEFARDHPRIVGAFFRLTDAATCLSSENLLLLKGLVPRLDVTLVPNPIKPTVGVPSVAGLSEPVVLYLGAVSWLKGMDVLVAAWRIVRSAMPEARCIAAGPSTDYVIPADSGIEVLGLVAHSEISQLLAAARLVCLPSRTEVLPMTLLEAMAAARPIVATPVGAVRTLTDQGGVSVPVEDAAALAEALLMLLRDPEEATRLGERGRAMCVAEFGVERVSIDLRAVYSRALA